MNWVRSTRVRLTRKLADLLNGIDLSRCSVGDHLEVSPRDAWLLITEGWAIACDEPQRRSPERDRRIPAAHQLLTEGRGSQHCSCSEVHAIGTQSVTDIGSSGSNDPVSRLPVAGDGEPYERRDDVASVRREFADRMVTIGRSARPSQGEPIQSARQALHEVNDAAISRADEHRRLWRPPNVTRTDGNPRPREPLFAMPHPPSDPKNASWVHRFHSILESLAADPAVSAAIVAKTMNLSPWHFSRLLMQRTQMGFRMHLSLTRLRIAARLLRETALSIKEVSARAGFTSASELNHHFRRAYRMTPTQYRTQTDVCFHQPPESQTLASISKNDQAS
jgi:AraC-like DNA-binding protein